MSVPLVVLRPEPGLSETMAAARAQGLEAIGAPLWTIEPVAWDAPAVGGFDAILLGSASAVRHGGPALERFMGLPVHAVGERTAAAARGAGFGIASVGSGGLQSLLDTLAGPLRLLRLAGEERVLLATRPGVTIEERVVYRACPLSLAGEAVGALCAGAVAALHSASAARRLGEECDRLGIARGAVALAALAPAIAEAAGSGWLAVRTAPAVTDAALLALAAELCQKPRGYAAGHDRD